MEIKRILKELYRDSPENIKSQIKQLAEQLHIVLDGEKNINTVRIAHISDIHISEKLSIAGLQIINHETGKPRKLEDIQRCFFYAIDTAIDNKCNIALITEPFDRPNPTPNEISVFVQGVQKLSQHMPVIVEPGNHGIDKNRKNESVFMFLSGYKNVYVTDTPKSFFFDGETIVEEPRNINNGVFIHVLPYPITYVNSDSKEEKKEMMLQWIDNFKTISQNKPSVLFAHLMVDSVLNEKLVNRIKEPVFSVNELNGFDYVALGHIHKFLKLSDRIYYSGNVERVDFDEENEPKGFIIADLNINTKELNVNFIETPATSMVNLTVSEFLSMKPEDLSPTNIYRVNGEIQLEEKHKYISHLSKFESKIPILSKVKIIKHNEDKQNKKIFDKNYKSVDDIEIISEYLSKTVNNEKLFSLLIKKHQEITSSIRK